MIVSYLPRRARKASEARRARLALVELLVVIGIIAIAAGASLPNIVGYMRGNRIRAAQEGVASAVQRARNLAIMRNSQMGVVFVTQDNTTYWVHVEDSIAGVTAGNVGFDRQPVNFTTPNAALSTRYELPEGVEFAANAADCPGVAGFAPGQASMRFDRYGASSIPTTDGSKTDLGVVGGAPLTRIFAPAGGDRTVCMIDRNTDLRRWLQISQGGRVVRR